jgi:hypothetical protein
MRSSVVMGKDTAPAAKAPFWALWRGRLTSRSHGTACIPGATWTCGGSGIGTVVGDLIPCGVGGGPDPTDSIRSEIVHLFNAQALPAGTFAAAQAMATALSRAVAAMVPNGYSTCHHSQVFIN